jgi:hypothetical protein
MKKYIALAMALSMGILSGCNSFCPATVTPEPPKSAKERQGKIGLSADEIKALRSKDNVVLSAALKKRLISSQSQLKLTPEEMQVLKSTGKVILCGKCGYLLKEKKFKDFENKGIVINADKNTGFQKDSLRERVILLNSQD